MEVILHIAIFLLGVVLGFIVADGIPVIPVTMTGIEIIGLVIIFLLSFIVGFMMMNMTNGR